MGFITESNLQDKAQFDTVWSNLTRSVASDDQTIDPDSREQKIKAKHAKIYMCAIQNFSFPWMHPPKTQDEDFSPRRNSGKFLGSLNEQGEYTMTV